MDMKMLPIDDRRMAVTNIDPSVDDRRVAATQRRKSPRMRTLKGAQIVPAAGGRIECIVRNLSQTGACIEVRSPIPHDTLPYLRFRSVALFVLCRLAAAAPDGRQV
jgi:hypothetical protein